MTTLLALYRRPDGGPDAQATFERRYTTEHTYRYEGNYTARFKMKQGKRIVASTTVNVQVRGGARDDIDE